MDKFKNKIADFLTSNNAWIYTVVLTVFSFMWVMTFVKLGGPNYSMVYLHADKWLLFFHLLLALHILFLPFFIFSLSRNLILKYCHKYLYYGIWALIFILFPSIVFGVFNLHSSMIPVVMAPEMVWMLANVLVFIDLITNPHSKLSFRLNFSKIKELAKPIWIFTAIGLYLSFTATFYIKMQSTEEVNLFSIWLQSLVPLIVVYAFYYINHYFLVEKILKEKGIIYYAFAFCGLVILFYIPYIACYYLLPAFQSTLSFVAGKYWVGDNPPVAFWAIHNGLARAVFLYTIPVIILIQWLTQENKINKLSKEKSETELTMLKQQINPHFFFNTLNNVYSMSLTKDEQTPEAILQLSDLMRYVIYKGQEETVTLSDEIKYIEDYLELQKMRLHQKFDLKFDKNMENSELLITPLLFIILIENAFKHGIEGAEYDSYLHLSLTQQGQQLTFTCVNSLEESDVPYDTGLGLTNLKRRLELVYPERYSLTTSKNTSSYTAELQISF